MLSAPNFMDDVLSLETPRCVCTGIFAENFSIVMLIAERKLLCYRSESTCLHLNLWDDRFQCLMQGWKYEKDG